MANKRLPLNKQLQVLYNTPEELRGLNDLCIKMTGKTLGYGGIVYIQDPGEKKKDSIYLDKFKPGLYYCKANSTTTSNDTSIFIDYSNYTIGNKLENYLPFSFYHPDRWTPKHEDELTKTGAYQISYINTTLKPGFVGSQCFVLVFNTSTTIKDWISQIAISYYYNFGVAYRTYDGAIKKWKPWKYFKFE